MFNSTVLEVAIGLTFCYAAVSLTASSINEAIASILRLRANTLLTGIQTLLNDPDFTILAQKIYQDALVHPLGDGSVKPISELKSIPAYIESKNFALALINIIQTAPGNFAQLEQDIQQSNYLDPQIKQLLLGFYQNANGDINQLHQQIASWFDSSMERVSGVYKRKSQLFCFIIALIIAGIFNIDSLHLFTTLWLHPSYLSQIPVFDVNSPHFTKLMYDLKVLPIGWNNKPFDLDPAQVFGWLITASTSLFGAPFWFDSLQKLIQLRSTGSKPQSNTK